MHYHYIRRVNGTSIVKAEKVQLLINTSGCKLEKIEPWDPRYPDIKDYFKKEPREPCNGLPLTIFKDGVLEIDHVILKEHFKDVKRCYYKPFDIELPQLNEVSPKDLGN